jgi:REP element-mobilizing transposase RayT
VPNDYIQLYVHLIWCTWDRLPLLTEDIESEVFAAIIAKCHELKTRVIALNGVADHIHLLVALPASLSVAKLVGQIKGASSHLIRKVLRPDKPFQWSGTYAAITVDPAAVERVAEYIRNQKRHHAAQCLRHEWEPLEALQTPLDFQSRRMDGCSDS